MTARHLSRLGGAAAMIAALLRAVGSVVLSAPETTALASLYLVTDVFILLGLMGWYVAQHERVRLAGLPRGAQDPTLPSREAEVGAFRGRAGAASRCAGGPCTVRTRLDVEHAEDDAARTGSQSSALTRPTSRRCGRAMPGPPLSPRCVRMGPLAYTT
jgi:hypothetical protein